MKTHLVIASALSIALLAGCVTINEPCGCPGAGGSTSIASTSVASTGGTGGASASSTSSVGGSGSSSATTGAGGAGGATASSSSTGPGCPVCTEALVGNLNGDRLCPSSTLLFATLHDCACVEPGACSAVCLIPETVPGDGATCPLTTAGGASSACTDCLADSATGCGASFSACVGDGT